jgi:hypothetical protein
MKLRNFAIIVALVALPSCGKVTVPAHGTRSDGIFMQGTTTASLKEGTFSVTGGGITCSGTYDPLNSSKRIEAKVTCTDGKIGVIYVVRDNNNLGGIGTAEFTDGTTGTFVFGENK